MEPTTNPTETEFSNAFVTEMGGTPEAPETTPPAPAADGGEAPGTTPPAAPAQVPPVEDDKPEAGEPAKPEGGDSELTDEEKAAAEAELAKGETPEETTARHAKEAAEKAANVETPAIPTKDDIKEAMRELNQESASRVNQVAQARDEVISKLYPEGIDQNIYDTNGNVIKTAQDIVDRGLINTRTGEAFTYDEAASFMLEASQKMAKNVEDLQNYAEKVAEDNINLLEGNQRVMAKWGETFKQLPKETVEQLAVTYINTQLKFDKTGSYVVEMNMTPEQYYATVMAPYSNLAASIAAKQEADRQAAEAAAAQKAKEAADEQAERAGLPPQRGQSDVKSNTGDPMLDALVDELKKG